MIYKIIVSPIASKNIEDAIEYYIEKATKKVASDFFGIYTKKEEESFDKHITQIRNQW